MRDNIWGWLLGGFIVIVVLVVGASLLNQQSLITTPTTPLPQGGASITSVTVRELLDNISNYTGKKLVVSGTIDTVYTQRLFTMDQSATDSATKILVVSKNPLPSGEQSGTNVTVEGTAGLLSVATVQKELGITFNPQVSAAWDGKTFIIADQVTSQQPTP